MNRNKFYTLITGASDGFGKALAIECARRNMNLILVALPRTNLSSLATFIRKNFTVDVNIFEKDLTKETDCYDLHLEILDAALQVNILINNAGMGNTQFFSETSPEFFKQQIKLNVLATTLLSSLFIPELKKCAPAYILNVGSLSGFFYLPQKQVYCATKSFIYSFSKSLRRELRQDNISVSVVCPGGMNTNFRVSFANRQVNFFSRVSILNPEEVAPIVIEKMLNRKEVIIPGTLNRVSIILDKLLPPFLKNLFTDRIMKDLKTSQQITGINSQGSPMAA
ncbi:MAG: short-chain dehydrogenase [Acidobacteria bacterium]|nr:MAG: short-chain dehydrogenase [Acidobacteriota bacterium]